MRMNISTEKSRAYLAAQQLEVSWTFLRKSQVSIGLIWFNHVFSIHSNSWAFLRIECHASKYVKCILAHMPGSSSQCQGGSFDDTLWLLDIEGLSEGLLTDISV